MAAVLAPWNLTWWLRWQINCLKYRRPRFDPWVGKIPWRRKWHPTLVFLPGEFHGQRSLAGYSPWVCKESDVPERVTLSTLKQWKCILFQFCSSEVWDDMTDFSSLGLIRKKQSRWWPAWALIWRSETESMYRNGSAMHSADPAGFRMDQADEGSKPSSSEPWQGARDLPRARKHGSIVGNFCEIIFPCT